MTGPNAGVEAAFGSEHVEPAAEHGVVHKLGHRIRIEVTSSDFPKFGRNLNTGGDNVTETKTVVARNAVHHAPDAASYVELPVLP